MIEVRLQMGKADEVKVEHNETMDLVVTASRRGQVVLRVEIECDGTGEGLVCFYDGRNGRTWSLDGSEVTPVEPLTDEYPPKPIKPTEEDRW